MFNSDVLILNSGFIPIRISSVRDAVGLMLADKAVPVLEEDRYIRSPSLQLKVPSVISLVGYSSLPRRKVVFSKLNVIYRDDMVCQYCGSRFTVRDLTVDHVIPRSRWETVTGRSLRDGFTSWENLVCACRWCNGRKGNRLLKEIGWYLPREPFEPEYLPHLVISLDKAKHRGWLPFCTFNVRLVHVMPESLSACN